jgi:hypothetical protein
MQNVLCRLESGYHLRVPEQFVYVEPGRGE